MITSVLFSYLLYLSSLVGRIYLHKHTQSVQYRETCQLKQNNEAEYCSHISTVDGIFNE